MEYWRRNRGAMGAPPVAGGATRASGRGLLKTSLFHQAKFSQGTATGKTPLETPVRRKTGVDVGIDPYGFERRCGTYGTETRPLQSLAENKQNLRKSLKYGKICDRLTENKYTGEKQYEKLR